MKSFATRLARRTLVMTVLVGLSTSMARAERQWAIAEFGEPLYQAGIGHWPYVNPDAPKGGKIVLGAFGSFDTLNFYVLKGEWPGSIGMVYDGLMDSSDDELTSTYGLIAESVEVADDKSWARFHIRPEARYHDGVKITAGDFVFGLETIKQHGRPFLKSFYEDVEGAEAIDDATVEYRFKTRDNMKPVMQVAGASPLPRHYWAGKDISKSTLEPPLSSGPYRVKTLEPGRSITYERVEDYWGADLPMNRGRYNFDEIRYDYYRDLTVMFEAFKSGELDFRQEGSAKRWATAYDLEAVHEGHITKRAIVNETPRGIGGYFFNLRRDKFKDVRVREALVLLYDFEALQRTLLYGYYERIASYFPNSDFGVSGPPSSEEVAILEPYRDRLPPAVLSEEFKPPKTDGSGRNRNNKRRALRLFKEAGWKLTDGKLLHGDSDEQLQIELMTAWPETERLALPYIEALKRAGIDASIRLVDSSQWRVRIDDSDFDLWAGRLNFFPPPGPELRSYFGSESADIRGSANSGGIKDPVLDELIEKIIAAKDLDTLKATNRALDRVLLWQYYAVPSYYNDESWIAHWAKFGYPPRQPRYSSGFPSTWWIDAASAAKLPK